MGKGLRGFLEGIVWVVVWLELAADPLITSVREALPRLRLQSRQQGMTLLIAALVVQPVHTAPAKSLVKTTARAPSNTSRNARGHRGVEQYLAPSPSTRKSRCRSPSPLACHRLLCEACPGRQDAKIVAKPCA